MDWKNHYQNRKLSAEAAIAKIESHDRVVVGHAAGEPAALVEEMVKQARRFKNVEIVQMVSMGGCDYCQAGMEPHFRHNSLFVGARPGKPFMRAGGIIPLAIFQKSPICFPKALCRGMSFWCNYPPRTSMAIAAWGFRWIIISPPCVIAKSLSPR